MAGIARVHVRAWQVAYRGELPDEYLDALRESDRADMWVRFLETTDEARNRLSVAVERSDVLGFACYGMASDNQGEDRLGELNAINVDPDHWRAGVGSALLDRVVDELASMGFERAILWTGVQNERAHRFYAKHGWAPDGVTKTDTALGAVFNEMRFARSLVSQ